jgi:hypothetical protein
LCAAGSRIVRLAKLCLNRLADSAVEATMRTVVEAAAALGLAAACCLAGPTAGLAQDVTFASLQGRSIVVEYREHIRNRRGEDMSAVWKDLVYFSGKGHIFHKMDMSGPHGAKEKYGIGDESGAGEGGPAFRWDGHGITRSWTNPRGIRLRQTIDIFRTASGFGCRMSIQRTNSRATVTVAGQTCRVVNGNVFPKA